MSYDTTLDNAKKYIDYHLKGRVKEQFIDDNYYRPVEKDGEKVREKIQDRLIISTCLGKSLLLKMIEVDPDKRLDVPGILNSLEYSKYISALKKHGLQREPA